MGFGQRVREIRKRLGLSLNDLEQRTGVNKGYLSQLENENQRNPSVHIAKRIADALGLGLDELLDQEASSWSPRSDEPLPPALAKYVALREKQGRPLGPRTIADLQRIQFRGKYPQQPEQYEILVNQLEIFTREPSQETP
ncbi:MAG TPA: helix-turn-helix transcriptional regulator [Candidatus Krumholzibacteria bacterium]|nr:helix-turn-helix transcriptional regulator [Candidatus Krumholzibacteria bacterium]HPD73364.1 helix-turn-helix transcriptional regulator [Candidatus Krumholzibacteria bacterium]HRY42115.1 helix-turn-helix transcriptional regulator [Candidatus Krumholzibacteria bacterium]